MSPDRWLPWADAWQRALYAGSGFYRSAAGPAGSFATSAQGMPLVGPSLAGAVVSLMRHEELTAFVDFGCGRGELVSLVQETAPDLECVGVDVVSRPASLPDVVRWVRSEGGPSLPPDLLSEAGLSAGCRTLVFANEWLDVVPCVVAELDASRTLRTVLVDPETGTERLGDQLGDVDLAWCQRFWPADDLASGDRVEVGLERDRAWASLVDALSEVGSGLVVAVDYGHSRDGRPASGTLTGYSHGHQVAPVPDGSSDITAHVAMDSLGADELVSQRDMLRSLGVRGVLPDHALARTEPTAYLQGLARSSAEAALLAPTGLGGFTWALTRVPGRLPV